ncbi:hypothetical protein AYI69_g10705 [Smittium culicis]|uniref:Uncharacterized protein n=1 Tax=Smittium culicis TaxID=133412 RepID=A0A1R1X407_9FUNG|nr:hypothetical protein AYI69_g10705 [Smittium culicis]
MALSEISIASNILNDSNLTKRPPNAPIPNPRDIAPNIAAKAVVPPDSIIAQIFWSNYKIFNNYYRLTRTAMTYITQVKILLEPLIMNSSNVV